MKYVWNFILNMNPNILIIRTKSGNFLFFQSKKMVILFQKRLMAIFQEIGLLLDMAFTIPVGKMMMLNKKR